MRQERADVVSRAYPVPSLPKFEVRDLAGHPLNSKELAGRAVMVEFWATWCPPCRSTLEWLGHLRRKYGDNLSIVTLAVESPEDKVRSTVSSLNLDLHSAMGDADTIRAFGDIVSVPTMFLFDRTGQTTRVFYGAPPNLHEQAEEALDFMMR